MARLALSLFVAFAAFACGGGDEAGPSDPGEAGSPETAGEAAEPQASGGASLPRGLMLAVSQFERTPEGPRPGAALLEFLTLREGTWRHAELEDPESNVFHKAMVYAPGDGDPGILTLGGSAAVLKLWRPVGSGFEAETIWKKDFGGQFSRMRDAETGDLLGDGRPDIAVATHDQGVVAVVSPDPDAAGGATGDGAGDGGWTIREVDAEKDTFVHEIEIGDLDGDGVLEFYATPSEPNRLDGSVQPGKVVRYVPARDEGRRVVADLGDQHAKEILVGDVDGDGRDELYVSVEGHAEGRGTSLRLTKPVEIRRYEADTDPAQGVVIASIQDRLCRFLTAGDVDGDGRREMVAATFSAGLWLLRPGSDPAAEWEKTLIDRDSAGFEHAALLADLDGDGRDELYVASDKHGEVRRYVWQGDEFERETIYRRPEGESVFTWNLMPVPVSLAPAG